MENVDIENDRQRQLCKIFGKLKEMEEERQGLSSAQSTHSATNRSSMSNQNNGFFNAANRTESSGFYNN